MSTNVVVERWKNDRIAARTERRFPGDYEMSKAVPGARWNPAGRFWHYALTMTTCRALREVYQDMLFIGPELSQWAHAEKKRLADVRSLGTRMDATLLRIPQVAPDIDAAMANRPYQRVGARFGAEAGSFLMADEPTLGKTIQYLGAIIEADLWHGNHLVVGPVSSVKSTWYNEILKWTNGIPYPLSGGAAKRRKYLDAFMNNDSSDPRFLIVNPEMLRIVMGQWCTSCKEWDEPRKPDQEPCFPMTHYTDGHNLVTKVKKQDWPEIHAIEWNSICVDEADRMLLGVRGPMSKSRTQVGEGFCALRMREGGLKIAATGTPLRGKAINFYPTFWWLRPKEWPSKWGFADSYLEVSDNGFGKTIGELRPEREEALYDQLSTMMLRRTKLECQPDLPKDNYLDHWVTMEDEHLRQYTELSVEGEVMLEGGALTTIGGLAEFTRQKQFAYGPWEFPPGSNKIRPTKGSPKFEKIVELLRKRGVTGDPETEFRLEGGYKYILASQSTEIVDSIVEQLEELGIQCLVITGKVTASRRDDAVTGFQSDRDPHRVMVMNTYAGGSSLTLDAWCDEMFILDETWVRDEQIQLEGRIRNREVEKRVAVRHFHYIRTHDTIEEEIWDSGLTQDEFQKQILDRRRGVKVDSRKKTKK